MMWASLLIFASLQGVFSEWNVTTSGDTTVIYDGEAFPSATSTERWHTCQWSSPDRKKFCKFTWWKLLEEPEMKCEGFDFSYWNASFFGDHQVCGLHINSVQNSHNGEWEVEVVRLASPIKIPKYLTLSVLKTPDDMKLDHPAITDGEIEVGSSYNVTCQVKSARPAPVLSWMLGDEKFNGTLGDVKTTNDTSNKYPQYDVEQTAVLFVGEDFPDVTTFSCISSIYNTSVTDNATQQLFQDTRNITLSKSESCYLPAPLSSVDTIADVWGCDGKLNGAKVGNDVSCTFRCGQGGLVNTALCSGTTWSSALETTCDYTNDDVFHFFDVEHSKGEMNSSLKNPPDSDFFNEKTYQFISPEEKSLHLFGISSGSEIIELQNKSDDTIMKMQSDSGDSSSTMILLLEKDDTILIKNHEAPEKLSFLGTSLHSLKGFSGTASKEMGVKNIPQNIYMTEHNLDGIKYDESTGCLNVDADGVYLIGLTLSSNEASYASLQVGDISLGLGDDTPGQGMMSNSAVMKLKKDDCIIPQMEPLSQVHDGDKWSQLFVANIPEGDHFCYALSETLYNENETPTQVNFDVDIFQNEHFDSGIFTIKVEKVNPRRFYLILVNAFMANGTLSLELGDDLGNWEVVEKVQAMTTDRRMVSVRKIVEMDNIKQKLRIRASGLVDEGDNHFATFCGIGIRERTKHLKQERNVVEMTNSEMTKEKTQNPIM